MNNLVLYAAAVLIWGSTWLAITFQLGVVDPLLSVGYRFALASALLLAYCLLTGKPMRFDLRAHGFIFLQGVCLFGMNYWLFYLTTEHLTSGLVAVTFCTIVFMNILNGRLIQKRPVRVHVAVAAVIGLIGIVLVFWPEFGRADVDSDRGWALVMAGVATYFASIGNIVSARNQVRQLPVLQTNAFGMGYGALLMLSIALFSGQGLEFDWSPAYVASLFYLAVFGSIVAFGCYLTLVGRIGADRAAYASLLFPLVALQLSVWFEGYQWTPQSLIGVSMVLIGNFIVLTPAGRIKWLHAKLARRPPAPTTR